MRIMHTSDWHLGRTIENNSRHEEQEAFLQFLAAACDEQKIDVIIVAGDIYDTANPPSRSQELFYRYAKILSDGGKRLVIVIAGNHDNQIGLSAAKGIATESGILIAGSCLDEFVGESIGDIKVLRSCEGSISVNIKSRTTGKDEVLNLALMPFLNEQRLGEIFISQLDDEKGSSVEYSNKVVSLLENQSAGFVEGGFSVIAGHLYVAGGIVSDSERPISIGGAYTVEKTHLSKLADYIALGHLHRSQQVTSNCFYSGSPLQYSKSEAGQDKFVKIVETGGESGFSVENHIVPLGKPVEVWKAKSLDDAKEICMENQNRQVWAYLEIDTDKSIEASEIKALHQIKPDLLSVLPSRFCLNDRIQEEVEIEELEIEDAFSSYFESVYGRKPDQESLLIFSEILMSEVE